MPNPKKNTEQVTFRIDVDLISKLKLINPALVTQSTKDPDKLKFRHGALGKYISRLIAADIEERKARAQHSLLGRFMSSNDD